jgi:hypothetical protein
MFILKCEKKIPNQKLMEIKKIYLSSPDHYTTSHDYEIQG